MPRLTTDIHFENKVINQADVARLIEIFAKLKVKRKKHPYLSERQDLTFSIRSVEGVDYDFDDNEIAALNTHFQTKQIEYIFFRYRDYKTNNELSFRLGTKKYSSSYFQITSERQSWFNDKKAIVEDFLKSVKDQQNFYLSNQFWIKPIGQFVLAVPFTFIGLVIISFVSKLLLSDISVASTPGDIAMALYWFWVLVILMNFVVGELIISKLFKYLDSMWPSIELESGPAHADKIRNRRQTWKYVTGMIIIPVIISILFYFLPN